MVLLRFVSLMLPVPKTDLPPEIIYITLLSCNNVSLLHTGI